MHSDASAEHASISQTFENSSGSMHAPPNLPVDALRAPERAWPLPWSSSPLDPPSCSFLGFCQEKSPIPSSEAVLRLSINCVKSDNFRAKAPENHSGPLFSATADPNEKAVGGGYPPEGGLSAGAGSGGEKWPGSPHNERTSWGPGALSEGFTQEVKS